MVYTVVFAKDDNTLEINIVYGGRVIVGHSRVVDAEDIVSVNLLDGSVTVSDYLVI